MPAPDKIDAFIAEVDRRLLLPPSDRRRVAEELRAHLDDALTEEVRAGASPEQGVSRALARIGDPASIAGQYARRPVVLDGLAALGAVACGGVAAWLLVIAATVLPTVDPERVWFWVFVAVGFLGLALLTGAYLALGRRTRSGGLAIGVVALLSIVAGARLAIPTLAPGADFEGYILLMGTVLMGQGAVLVADVVASHRRPRVGRLG
jgi:hypothetical protein